LAQAGSAVDGLASVESADSVELAAAAGGSSFRDEIGYAILDRLRTGGDALADGAGTALGHIGKACASSTNSTATRCGGASLVGGLRAACH
jgi:hypothetical protein